ncbi:MAG TPA: flavin reductase [Aeromicrobium sp.]|nr:flavin reductase [Aeromicrobium sp.]
MTIHSEHPFTPRDGAKDALRQLRGRLVAPVTIVATGAGRDRAALTVSSLQVVDGSPGRFVAMIDPDADLGEAIEPNSSLVVSLLEAGDEFLAEAFAGLAPAPGGVFTLGDWEDTDWGPALAGRSWCAVRVDEISTVGWSLSVLGTIVHVEIAGPGGLSHLRGRYFQA